MGYHVQKLYQSWKQIAPYPRILSIILEGLRLHFVQRPQKSEVRVANVKNSVHMLNILKEVENLFEKGAIEHIPKSQEGEGFYSTFFTVPKKKMEE